MHEQPASVSAVVYAKSLTVVSSFYEQTLQLERVEVEATHVLLSRDSTEVAIVQAPESSTASVALASLPSLRTDTPLKLSFLVAGFARVREAARRTGGSLKPEEAAWSWRGCLHLDGSDPEGNVVQFRVPSGSPTG